MGHIALTADARAKTSAVCSESLWIFTICLLDTAVTTWLVMAGLAHEANPFMASVMNHSMAAFWAVKMSTVAGLVCIAEWYRKQNPVFVRRILRVGLAGYLGLYVISVALVNI